MSESNDNGPAVEVEYDYDGVPIFDEDEKVQAIATSAIAVAKAKREGTDYPTGEALAGFDEFWQYAREYYPDAIVREAVGWVLSVAIAVANREAHDG